MAKPSSGTKKEKEDALADQEEKLIEYTGYVEQTGGRNIEIKNIVSKIEHNIRILKKSLGIKEEEVKV